MLKKFFLATIRESWIETLYKNGYTKIDSFSVVPENDDSLFFLNSGVSALKKYFSFVKIFSLKDVVNSQLVIRTLDMDRVCFDSFHQTSFEMLGAFSIDSGKFKKDIIPVVWGWLTSKESLDINPKNLFVTVWEKDSESYSVWKSLSISDKNIFLGDKKSNFWDLGDGPCGPNTEIYFLLNTSFFPESIEDLNTRNCIEIGNIVFPEFYHYQERYELINRKCIDVGMGLERITMIKQKKRSVFEIDGCKEVINKIYSYYKKKKIQNKVLEP